MTTNIKTKESEKFIEKKLSNSIFFQDTCDVCGTTENLTKDQYGNLVCEKHKKELLKN